MIRLATVFSGIGAIEHALQRLELPHNIVFACDNGDIEVEQSEEEIKAHLSTLRTAKEKKEIY
jgi:DNA (cytosine-5)-methyltransferase 1